MAVSDHTLVHGDFHHYNLLRHGDRWLAIDPKPYVGEPEYDVAPVVWQPTPTNPTRDQVERRIAAFVDVGLDADRIREWILVRGAYLAFPLSRDETEDSSPQLRAARLFL
jgi:streptomycin 6-kinase